MRKFIVTAALLLGLTAITAEAQIKFGIKGAFTYTSLNLKEATWNDMVDSKTGYNFGAALNIDLPLGFAIQPEVAYIQTGTQMEFDVPIIGKQSVDLNIGSLEVPVGIQWGIRLGPVRPFVQCVPYLSIPLAHTMKLNDKTLELENNDELWSKVNGGVGVGFGLDVWKLQLSCRYKWDLGNIVQFDGQSAGDIAGEAISAMKDESKMSGVEVSLALFF